MVLSFLTLFVFAVRTSLYITSWASHNRTDSVAKIALMPVVDDVPEFSDTFQSQQRTSLKQQGVTRRSALPVHFQVRIVEVIAEWRVIVLIIVIIIVASN